MLNEIGQHKNLRNDEKLNGLQALVIYTLLQASDQTTRMSDDAALIVSTCEVCNTLSLTAPESILTPYHKAFSKDLFTSVAVTYEAEEGCSSRRDWVLIESLRRYMPQVCPVLERANCLTLVLVCYFISSTSRYSRVAEMLQMDNALRRSAFLFPVGVGFGRL